MRKNYKIFKIRGYYNLSFFNLQLPEFGKRAGIAKGIEISLIDARGIVSDKSKKETRMFAPQG